jgi:flavodoxin
MKRLFIYYSLSGNGDLVANFLKEKDFEIRKVESKLKLSKNLFLCMMKGGFLALTGSKPKLINYDNNIDNYDEVVIGSPIWNGRFAAPTNTILKETNLEGKKLTFILYAGGGEAPKTVKKINKLYPNSKVITLKQPKKYASELEKIEF